MKTSTSDNDLSSETSDGAARHDGGIVAQIRYRLPIGAVRSRLSKKAIAVEDVPVERVPWKAARTAKRNTDEITDFIKDLDVGTVLPASVFVQISDVPRRTVNRALLLALSDGILERIKWGHYKRVTPPESPKL